MAGEKPTNPLIASILGGYRQPAGGKPKAASTPEYNADGTRRRLWDGDRPTMRRQDVKRRLQRVTREASAASQIAKLPEPGEDVFCILTGDWHGWDIVAAVLELSTVQIGQLHIATLGFNRQQCKHMADLIDAGDIKSVAMVVSEIFSEKSNGEYNEIAGMLRQRGCRIASTRNHAKLLCFELTDGRKIVAHGSLNLRRCNSFEQVAISNDPALYQFFVEFIEEQVNA